MLVGVEASSPSEDQGVSLAPATTAPDDKVPTAAHGPRTSHRMLAVHKGSGGFFFKRRKRGPLVCGPLRCHWIYDNLQSQITRVRESAGLSHIETMICLVLSRRAEWHRLRGYDP